MVVFESLLVGIIFAGIGVLVTAKPREIFLIRQSVAVASTGELGEFGVARYQAYGLLCVLLGLLLVLIPFFLL
ncbi:hypothetical protein [Haladaptatus sp. W1]|uniref:hypothetical protein n=1 Tax=Haladaptatus sp. W1 TaxID=1897478 RepID=UPI000A753A5B|nr:hypothetical protein [Haladaptatus sp. W1]